MAASKRRTCRRPVRTMWWCVAPTLGTAYTMNNYNIRVYGVSTPTGDSCGQKRRDLVLSFALPQPATPGEPNPSAVMMMTMQTPSRRAMTLTQKILAAHAMELSRPWVQAGDILRVKVDWTIASELAWNGMDKTYQALGRPPLHNADRFFWQSITPSIRRRCEAIRVPKSWCSCRGTLLPSVAYATSTTRTRRSCTPVLSRPAAARAVVIGADSHTSSHG